MMGLDRIRFFPQCNLFTLYLYMVVVRLEETASWLILRHAHGKVPRSNGSCKRV